LSRYTDAHLVRLGRLSPGFMAADWTARSERLMRAGRLFDQLDDAELRRFEILMGRPAWEVGYATRMLPRVEKLRRQQPKRSAIAA
jgi:hypothetical protein